MSDLASLDFLRLSDLPDLSNACAQFHAKLAGDDSEDGLDMRKAAFRRLALDGAGEDALVAVHSGADKEGEIAGLAVLLRTELEAFDDLGPWLSGITIDPSLDADNLTASLINGVEEMAREMGNEELFTQTADPEHFRTLGYQNIEPFDKNGSEHWVLGKAL